MLNAIKRLLKPKTKTGKAIPVAPALCESKLSATEMLVQGQVLTLCDYEDGHSSEIGTNRVLLGMGCFFGAEHHLSGLNGVLKTTVGRATGTGMKDGAGVVLDDLVPMEVVDVTFDPEILSFDEILKSFFENHHCFMDPEIYTPKHVRSCIFVIHDQQVQSACLVREEYSKQAETRLGFKLSTVIGIIESYQMTDDSLQSYHTKHPGAIEHKRSNGLLL
jgi:peptide-methionine (S)-S-oxide reductase